MVYKVSLFITLLVLAVLLAANVNWVSQSDSLVIFVLKVGVISAVVAAFALLFDR